MSAKEDLQKKIEGLNQQLDAAQKSLNAILVSEFKYKVGDKVEDRSGHEFTISRIGIKYGSPSPYGKKTLKSGLPGNVESELYWLR